MSGKQLLFMIFACRMISACTTSSTETREMLPEPNKELREKYEHQQDNMRNQEVRKIPMH